MSTKLIPSPTLELLTTKIKYNDESLIVGFYDPISGDLQCTIDETELLALETWIAQVREHFENSYLENKA